MTLSEYSNLKRQIVVAFGNKDTHKDLLKTVKNIFEADINSVRRLESIQTIGQLLKTLELRGLLWDDNIQPLKDIANAIESYDLLRKLTSYEELYIPREYSNLYGKYPCYYVHKLRTFHTKCILQAIVQSNQTQPLCEYTILCY